MKTIELKRMEDADFILDWKIQMLALMRRPLSNEQGMDIEEVRKSIRVIEALEKANGWVKLEDADYEHLKRKVVGARWAIAHPFVIQLVDDVNNAVTVIPDAPKDN